MSWVDVDYARSVVKQMYPYDKWRRRVRNMSDEQVLAIYYKHEESRVRNRTKTVSSGEQTHTLSVKEIPKHDFAPYILDEGEQLSLSLDDLM